MPSPSNEELLCAAWKNLAPMADTSRGFPRGFWPDVARVALEMLRQDTLSPILDFRPTMTTTGQGFETRDEALARIERNAASRVKADAATRAANTAALLAQLRKSQP